jgi:hypothetical protein
MHVRPLSIAADTVGLLLLLFLATSAAASAAGCSLSSTAQHDAVDRSFSQILGSADLLPASIRARLNDLVAQGHDLHAEAESWLTQCNAEYQVGVSLGQSLTAYRIRFDALKAELASFGPIWQSFLSRCNHALPESEYTDCVNEKAQLEPRRDQLLSEKAALQATYNDLSAQQQQYHTATASIKEASTDHNARLEQHYAALAQVVADARAAIASNQCQKNVDAWEQTRERVASDSASLQGLKDSLSDQVAQFKASEDNVKLASEVYYETDQIFKYIGAVSEQVRTTDIDFFTKKEIWLIDHDAEGIRNVALAIWGQIDRARIGNQDAAVMGSLQTVETTATQLVSDAQALGSISARVKAASSSCDSTKFVRPPPRRS